MLAIAAAGIALLTFVVQQTLRDRARDVADTVNRAWGLYQIRKEHLLEGEKLDNIYQRVRYPKNQQRDVDLIASDDSYQVYLVTVRVQIRARNSLDAANELMADLPGMCTGCDMRDELQRELQEIDCRLEDFDNSLPNTLRKGPLEQIPKELISALKSLSRDSSFTANRIREFSDSVFTQARNMKEYYEKRYQAWVLASYGLYPFSWIIALLGQLCGIESKDTAG